MVGDDDAGGLGELAFCEDAEMVTQEQLVEELRRVAATEGPDVTLWRFEQLTGIDPKIVQRRCGGMRRLREAAGLPAQIHWRQFHYSDEELLEELSRVEGLCGRFPTQTAFDRVGRFAWITVARRFGTRAEVLERYQHWQESRSIVADERIATECQKPVEPRMARSHTNADQCGDGLPAILPTEPLLDETLAADVAPPPVAEGVESSVPMGAPLAESAERAEEENLPQRWRWLRQRLRG